MTPSPTISLFTLRPEPGPQAVPFAASIIFHSLAVLLVWFSIAYRPPIAKVTTEHFPVRQLDLRMPDQLRRAALARVSYPGAHKGDAAQSSAGKPSPLMPSLRQMAQARRGPQTLIQADLPKSVTLTEEIPVPQVVIWSPSKATAKEIVPPMPDKPTSADVKTSLDRPNQETNLSDVNIASSNNPSAKTPVAPATTSPIAVHVPQQVQLPPVTASQSSAQPTPASVISLSDLRMKEGTAALPPVNESSVSDSPGILAPGQMHDLSPPGKDNLGAKPRENGAGNAASSAPGSFAKGSAGSKPETVEAGVSNGIKGGAASGSLASATEITLPKDGRFSAVVVGASLENQYPEMAGAWNGRMAYTVYLHVGLSRSWVLQYSLPRSVEAASSGVIARLEAPWPYNIVRPNLAPGSIDADALMVHGYVDQSGRFDTLKVVFPQDFPEARFVLAALEKWQFRPAMQNGQSTRVEILLIIPEQIE